MQLASRHAVRLSSLFTLDQFSFAPFRFFYYIITVAFSVSFSLFPVVSRFPLAVFRHFANKSAVVRNSASRIHPDPDLLMLAGRGYSVLCLSIVALGSIYRLCRGQGCVEGKEKV